MNTNKRINVKKIVLCIVVVLLAFVGCAGIAIYSIWHNELSTFMSIEMLRDRNDEHQDGAVYAMHVKGDFYLDEFVEQGGVSNDAELIDFVTSKITKGLISMNISRAFVDVNRDKIEIDPQMYYNYPQREDIQGGIRCRVGFGVIHRINAQRENIYSGLFYL